MGKWKQLSKVDIQRIRGLYCYDRKKGILSTGQTDTVSTSLFQRDIVFQQIILQQTLEMLLGAFNPAKTSVAIGRPPLVEPLTTPVTTTSTEGK